MSHANSAKDLPRANLVRLLDSGHSGQDLIFRPQHYTDCSQDCLKIKCTIVTSRETKIGSSVERRAIKPTAIYSSVLAPAGHYWWAWGFARSATARVEGIASSSGSNRDPDGDGRFVSSVLLTSTHARKHGTAVGRRSFSKRRSLFRIQICV